MEQEYIFLDHTSDAKFQAFGRNLEEAFANAALATASLMWDPERVEPRVRRPVRVRGRDLEQLLVRFLAEIIYLLETKTFLLHLAEEIRIKNGPDGFRLEGVFSGDENAGRYDLHGEVKAVTYNEIKIETADRVTLQVVLDI
jgi:SHS2 domain-containing protein